MDVVAPFGAVICFVSSKLLFAQKVIHEAENQLPRELLFLSRYSQKACTTCTEEKNMLCSPHEVT